MIQNVTDFDFARLDFPDDELWDEIFDDLLKYENSQYPITHAEEFWLESLPNWIPAYYQSEFNNAVELLDSDCFDDALHHLQYLGSQHLYPERSLFKGYPLKTIFKMEFQGQVSICTTSTPLRDHNVQLET